MDPAAIAGLCLLLMRGGAAAPPPPGVSCPSPTPAESPTAEVLDGRRLATQVSDPTARDAIARVAFAEAGNQGDSGLAGVVYTILNRLADGRWGLSVDAVLNAPHQFEPVMRAGGDWRRLPPVSEADQARVDTILNLALEGRLPDLTHGARFFQNPAVVAARARSGLVPARLVNFGGQAPTAIIGAHSFYTGQGGGGGGANAQAKAGRAPNADPLFVGRTVETPPPKSQVALSAADAPAAQTAGPPTGDPSRALFVTADGVVRANQP